MPKSPNLPTDEDFKRGYSVSPGGKITLLRPLPRDDLSDLFDHHPDQTVNLGVQQVELEMAQPSKPRQRSRQSQASNGYIHLIAWSNACLLRILLTAWFRWYRGIHGYDKGFYPEVRLLRPVLSVHAAEERDYGAGRNLQDFKGPIPPLTSPPLTSPKSPLNSFNFTPSWINPKLLDRLEAQLLDAIRSTIANIEEGHARPTTIEYLTFLGYTQASLKESKGDVQRLVQDGLLPRRPGSALSDLGINLADWHSALKRSVISRPTEDKGFYPEVRDYGAGRNLKEFPLNPLKSPLNSYKFDYLPVDNFDPAQLTYEMLIELVNKTDWNLRQLVGSLEEKLNKDKQYYLVEQARVKGKINWRK